MERSSKMAMLKKLKPMRIFEQVVQQIRDLIKNGELQPGDKLPTEQELEQQLSVSRSSVREALRVLEFEGLVEVRRGSGTYVSNTQEPKTKGELAHWLIEQEEMLLDVLEVRGNLEGLNASLSALRANEDELGRLATIIAEMEELKKGSLKDCSILDEMVRLDSHFHLTISEISGNSISKEIISQIIPAFQEGNKAVIYVSEEIDKTIRDHKRILAAIKAKDPKKAEKNMRDHITRVRRDVENIKQPK